MIGKTRKARLGLLSAHSLQPASMLCELWADSLLSHAGKDDPTACKSSTSSKLLLEPDEELVIHTIDKIPSPSLTMNPSTFERYLPLIKLL